MGKKEFLFLKRARATALKLEGQIERAKLEIETHQKKINDLLSKLKECVGVDYTTQKEKIQKNRKAHVEKKRREKERLHQEIDDKRNMAETILSNVKLLGLVLYFLSLLPLITRSDEDRFWTSGSCLILSFILVAILNDDPTVKLKNLEREEQKLQTHVNTQRHDSQLRKLAREKKQNELKVENLQKELEKNKAAVKEKTFLVVEKQKQLLELLESVDHLVP